MQLQSLRYHSKRDHCGFLLFLNKCDKWLDWFAKVYPVEWDSTSSSGDQALDEFSCGSNMVNPVTITT